MYKELGPYDYRDKNIEYFYDFRLVEYKYGLKPGE
jgi:hypothetical protein